MTAAPEVPAAVAAEVAYADGVLAGRVMSSAVFLAGLLANGELETVGRPSKLPADLFPHVDAAVVQAIWDRALAVGLHAGRRSSSPRLHRDEFARVQEQLAEAGWEAMAGLVSRSRRLVVSHPADGETARGRNSGVMNGPNDTGEGTQDR